MARGRREADYAPSRREKLLSSDASPLERVYWLLEDAKRYGTLPFAGLARSRVHRGADAEVLRRRRHPDGKGVRRLSGISVHSRRVWPEDRATLDKATFLSRYGHLRPGTYDILSPRYDEAPEMYFDWSAKQPSRNRSSPFR